MGRETKSNDEPEPSAPANPEGVVLKKVDIYKKALRRTLASGTEQVFNDPVLKELRSTLKITKDEHEKLKAEISAELSSLEQQVKESKQKISNIEKQISTLKKKGIDTKIIEDLLGRARDAFNEQSYLEVDAYSDQCNKILKKQQRNYLVYQKLERVKKNISKAEKMGANVKHVKELLKKAEASVENNKLKAAQKIATEAGKLSNELRKFGTAKKQLQKFQQALTQAKKKFDVTECEELMVQAQKALKENKYSKVSSTITSARKLLNVSKRHFTATEKVNKINEMVESSHKTGLDLKNITPMVEKLKKHLENKDYIKLSTQSTTIRKALDEARKHKNASDKIAEAQTAIEEAKEVGSTAKTANRLLSQAKTALKKKKYTNVHKYARSAIKVAKEGRVTALRRKATSAISSARFLIKEVKDFGADVAKAEALLIKADNELIKKNFNEAQKYAEEAEQLAKEIFDQEKKKYLEKGIQESMLNVNFIFEELDEQDIDFTEAKDLYNEATAKFKAGDYENAEKLIKESENLARKFLEDTKYQQRLNKAKEEIKECKELLKEAKALNLDVGSIQEFLDEAEKLLKQKKFDELIEKTEGFKDKITKLKDDVQKSRTKLLIDTTTGIITEAKNLGADLTDAEAILDEVNKRYSAKDYKKAEELAKKSQEIAEKVWSDYRSTRVTRAIENARQVMLNAEKEGIDVSKGRELIDQASVKINEGEYETAEELISKCETMVAKNWNVQRKNQANEKLTELRKVYSEIKVPETDQKELDQLMSDAEKEIKAENFEAVNSFIKQAESLAFRHLLSERTKVYSDKIKRSKKSIEKSKEIGLDTHEIEELLVEAEKRFKDKDFENVDKYIEQIDNKNEALIFNRRRMVSTKLIGETRESIGKSRKIGADVNQAEELLTQAEELISDENFDITNAEELLSKATTAAKQSWKARKTELTVDAVNSAKTMIQETKEMGVDVSEAEQLLQQAEEMFKEEDFEEIDDYLIKVKDMVKSTQAQHKSELVTQAVSTTKELLAETREMGADVTEAEDLLTQAESMFHDSDFDAVDEYVKKAENALKTSQKEFKREEKSKTINTTREKISEGREKGADVSEAEEILAQAENMLLSEGDFELVENLIQQSQSSLAISWDQFRSQRLIDEISKMHGKIEQFRSQGVNVSMAEELLHNAEKEYKSENMDNVEELLEKVTKVVEKDFEEEFTRKITLMINEVQNQIKQAKEMDLDVTSGEELLKKAIAEFDQKNFPKAEQYANKAKEIVKELLESFEKEETLKVIERVQSLIIDAKGFNIDVTPAERLFRQAKALYKTGEFKSCQEYAQKSEDILNTLAKKHIQNVHPHLTVEVQGKGLQTNKWNKLQMIISNEGQIKAQDVQLGIKGDFEIKGKKKIEAIDPENQVELELGFNCKKVGELPIKILMKCLRPFDLNEYKFTSEAKVKIQETGKFIIVDIFLIYMDGCLILHKTREYREIVDEDIFSGMLVAVQNFVTDSFRKTSTEGLRRLDFGRSKILLENGPKFFIALVMEGEEPGRLPMFMVETINEIQEEFGETLEDWDGNLEKLEGIEKIVNKLLYLEVVPGTDDLIVSEEYYSTITTVQSMMSDVKELGIVTTEVEKELEEAEAIVENADYSKVMNHIVKAENIVKKARRDYYHDDVKNAISTVKQDISEAQSEGMDVAEAEEILNKMKELVQTEAFPDVLKEAETAKVIIEQIQQQKQILNALERVDRNLKLANDWGVIPSDSVMDKNEIKNAIDSNDFEKAEKIINKTNDQLKESIEGLSLNSLDFISGLNKDVEEIKNIGLETTATESKQLIDSAIQSIKDLDLVKAQELLESANNKITTNKNQYLQGRANTTISTVRESMSELQELDVNIQEAEKLLSDVEDNFNKEDFMTALELASNLQEQLDKTKHDYLSKPILDLIVTAEANINNAKVHGTDETLIHPVEEMVGMTKISLEAKEYTAAQNQINQALKLANETFDFLKDEKEGLRAQLDSAMSILTSTKEIGMDTTEVEGLMSRMRDVLDRGDIESTRSYMEHIQRTLETMQVPYKIQVLTQEISKLERYLNETKEKGIDTAEAEHLVENAKAMLDGENLSVTDEYIQKARETLDNANKTHKAIVISETIQSTYKLVSDVKAMGAEVSYAQDLLNQAGEMLKNMNLDTAEELVTNALSTAQDVKKDFLSKEATEQINKAEQEIANAKQSGLKTVDAERMLNQAKDFLTSGALENSKQYAMNAQQLIVDIKEKLKGARAREELAYIKTTFEELKSMGANVIPVEAPMIQAEASLKNKDYDIAISYLHTAKSSLIEIKKPFSIKMAKEALSRANKAIIDARNYGADIGDAQNVFNDAQKAFSSHDYDTAEEKSKRAENLALVAQEKYYDNYVSNEIKTLKDNIDHLKTQGFEVTQVEDLLSKVNSMYLDKDFQGIGEIIKSIRELIIQLEESKYIDRAKDEIAYSRAMINYIKHNIPNIGNRIKQPERILSSAEELMKSKDYARAEQLAVESQRAVEDIKHSNLEQFLFVFKQLQAEEMLNQTKNVIANIKKIGVDLTEVEEKYKQAEEEFRSGENYNQAKELLTEAKIIAHEKENRFQEKNASSAISTAESLILTLKQNGVDVESADKFLNQAKTALEIREFKKSILFAGKAKFTAKKLMAEIPAGA